MSEMLVTVVHDDMDCTKYQIKTLRDGLKHVTPKVNFKSCCVWEFTDKVFDENSHVLVILSKQCQSFRRKVLEAFQKYRERCRRVNCRVCVVFEVDGGSNNKRLERSINGENTADVNAEKNNENNSENLIHTENAAVANFKENGTEETSESVEGKADNINTVKESSYETNLQLATANETTVVIEDFDATSSDDLGSMTDKDDNAVANNEDEMIKNDSGKLTINDKVVVDEAMGECSKDPSHIGNDAVLESGVEMINENLERKFKRKRQCWKVEDDDETINKNSMNNKCSKNVIYVKSCDETIQKDPDDETHKACDRTVREDSRCETDKAHDRIMREDSERTTIKIDDTQILDDSESEPHKGNVTMVDSDTGGRAVEEFELATLKQTTVVTSADKDDINKEFEDAIGKENVAVLEKLNQSVKWLPKVCAFLFKTNKRTKSLKCIVPNVKDSSVIRDFRVHLLNSLRDLYIDISEGFEQLPPRCCILFREDDDYDLAPSIENIKSETKNIKRTGGTIFEYNRPCTVKPEMQTSNEIMYGRESVVLFMIHLLYVMEVINITTMHGQRLWRIKKETVDCDACETPLEVCDELDCNVTWSFERGRFIGFLVLSLFNPSLLLLFLTPFPYTCGKKRLRKLCLIWLVICSMIIYGGVSYFLWSLENTLHFYLFVGFGFYSLLVSGCFQIKLLKLREEVQKLCFFCKCSGRCVGFAFLLFFNPSLLIFFLTPFPYMAIILCKQSLKHVCFVWLVFCSMALYGGVSYFLWTLGNTLNFYLFVGVGLYVLCLSGFLQIFLLELNETVYGDCLICFFILFLSPCNPSVLIFFFTPFPYILLLCLECDDVLKCASLIWSGICSFAIYLGLSIVLLVVFGNFKAYLIFFFTAWLPLVGSGLAQRFILKHHED